MFGANGGGSGEVDFESLVKGTASPAMGNGNPSTSTMGTASLDPWDEGWADSGDLDTSLVSIKSSLGISSGILIFSLKRSSRPLRWRRQ